MVKKKIINILGSVNTKTPLCTHRIDINWVSPYLFKEEFAMASTETTLNQGKHEQQVAKKAAQVIGVVKCCI